MFEVNGSLQHLWFDQGATPAGKLGDVPNSPSMQAGAKFSMPLVPRFITLMTRFALEGPRADRNDNPTDPVQLKTPYAFLWDAVISGQLPEWHLRGSIGLYNLANWHYTQPLSREFGAQNLAPQQGRRLQATLAFTL